MHMLKCIFLCYAIFHNVSDWVSKYRTYCFSVYLSSISTIYLLTMEYSD